MTLQKRRGRSVGQTPLPKKPHHYVAQSYSNTLIHIHNRPSAASCVHISLSLSLMFVFVGEASLTSTFLETNLSLFLFDFQSQPTQHTKISCCKATFNPIRTLTFKTDRMLRAHTRFPHPSPLGCLMACGEGIGKARGLCADLGVPQDAAELLVIDSAIAILVSLSDQGVHIGCLSQS